MASITQRLAITGLTVLAAASLAAAPAAAQAMRDAPRTIRGADGGPRHDGHRPGDGNTGGRINIGNDVDIDIDTDPGWDHDHDHDHDHDIDHPVAVGIAVGAALTAGTRVYVLPTGCVTEYYGAVTYYYCGSIWYRPYYEGTTITYVVVDRPF